MLKAFTRTDAQTVRQIIKIYKEEVSHDKRNFWLGITLIPLGHMLLHVMLPLFISLILQSIITNSHDFTAALYLVGGMAVVSLMAVTINSKAFPTFFNHEEYISTRLMNRAMNELLSHSHHFFANTKVGSLSGDVFSFSRSYMTIFDAIMLQSSPIIVNFVTSLIIISILSPVLLLPLGILSVAIVLHSFRSMERRAVYRNQRKTMTSKLNGTIADIMGNQLLVRVFARAPQEIQTVSDERTAIQEVCRKEHYIIQYESNIRQSILYVFQIGTILACIWLFAHGNISIAALVFAVSYLGRITSSLFNITAIFRTIEQGLLDASPVTEILQKSIEVADLPSAPDIAIREGGIVFDKVSFKYGEAVNEKVFDRLSLTIAAGQKIGLAGHSGGGKTTFTQLLLRFADVQEGSIMIDGQDISTVTQASLRSNIAYIPQEPFLFHRSLRENIAYGKPDASDDDIIAAARKAHAMEFIDKLPHSLDTVVGERGIKLSGGQRQRIAIARAILKDAPILILDEATSALDSESEKLIQASMTELMKDRTGIVIAHRLSTIAKLDRIIVIDDGQIVEDGTHQELLAKGGKYASLWRHQSGGFIEG